MAHSLHLSLSPHLKTTLRAKHRYTAAPKKLPALPYSDEEVMNQHHPLVKILLFYVGLLIFLEILQSAIIGKLG